MARNGILLDANYDPVVVVRRDTSGKILGGLVVGETTMQDTAVVLRARPGDVKEDPVLGVGLTRYIRGSVNAAKLEQDIRLHLARVGVEWDEVKEQVQTSITN